MVRKVFSMRGRGAFLVIAVLAMVLALPAIADAGFYVNARVESPARTVFRGNVWVGKNYIEDSDDVHSIAQHTAISTIDEAARRAGFAYQATDYGPLFVTSVDGLSGEGFSGWLFRVNGAIDWMAGSDQWLLKPGDKVLWYYGVTGWGVPGAPETTPLAVQTSSTAPALNTTLTVSVVEVATTGEATTPVQGAIVAVGSRSASTDATGQAQFPMSSAGTFQVIAEKDGYVRSETRNVKVAHASSLSFYARPGTVRLGQAVSISGALRSNGQGLRGRAVSIQQKYGSAWRTLRVLSTGATGVFRTWLRPPRSAYYRAVFAGDASHQRATSVVRRVAVVR